MSGTPYGRRWSWWKWNSKMVTLDPNKIHTADTPVDPRVLAAYIADSKRRSTDKNDPCVVLQADGTYHVLDGKHRVLAARAARRKIRVRLAKEPRSRRGTEEES